MKSTPSSPLHFGIAPQDLSGCQVQHEQKKGVHTYRLTIANHAVFHQPIILRGLNAHAEKMELKIEVGTGVEVDLIEHWEGVKTPPLQFNLDLRAQAYSQVRYVALQSEEAMETWQEHRQTHALESAQIRLFLFHFGPQSIFSQVEQNAEGRQAYIETWITSRRDKNQAMKLNYQHRFHCPEGSGKAHLQGVALDEAKLEMKGNIWISPQGKGADTHLEEKILNLSSKTQVSALPGLEANTNDVKAGHSAAVHNLNPEQLIYAQSRGLNDAKARRLMMEGFLKKGLRELKDLPTVYEKILALI